MPGFAPRPVLYVMPRSVVLANDGDAKPDLKRVAVLGHLAGAPIAANIAETGILSFDSCFPDSVVGFVGDVNLLATRYVELFIRTAKDSLERFAPATAQKNINLDTLSERLIQAESCAPHCSKSRPPLRRNHAELMW